MRSFLTIKSVIQNILISHWTIKALMVTLIIITFWTLIKAEPWGDELYFHYPNAKYFSVDRVINLNSSYSSAYTPLPYAMGHIVLQIEDNILYLRIFNFLIFLLLIYFFFKLSINISNKPLLLTLLLVSNPYLIRSAFTYYMFNYGILFAIAGIYFYFFYKSRYNLFISHVLLGLAVLCSQWMIVIIISLFLSELMKLIKNEITSLDFIKSSTYKTVCIIPSAIIFLYWQGFTHPNFNQHSLYPTFEHLNGTLANWGFITFFLLISNFKYLLNSKILLFVVIFLPLLFISIPEHASSHGQEVITGVAAQISTQFESIFLIPYQLSMFILIISGLLTLIYIIKSDKNNFEFFISFILVSLLTIFTASTKLGASHIYISIPFLILYFQKKILENGVISTLVTIQLYIISIFYIFHHAYLTPKI